MSNHPLNVSFVENKAPSPPNPSTKNSRRQETQATMERLWFIHPEQFDPNRNCLEKERIQRTFNAILNEGPVTNKKIVDLGCGSGILSRLLADAGGNIDAVDVATNALVKLKQFPAKNIQVIQDCLPLTKLEDDHYDIVICTDVIGYLKPAEHRLFIAELARLVKSEGIVVCSTPLDIDTEDPLEHFLILAETEFTLEKWVLSYHRLSIKLMRFFGMASYFIKANKDREFFKQEELKSSSLGKSWLRFNSNRFVIPIWYGINFLTKPLSSLLKNSVFIMNQLEKFCRLIWSQAGISHALFIGKRRPLLFPLPDNQKPAEMKHKKQVWE